MSSDYYLQFIEAIDGNAANVSDWEADFCESMLKNRPQMLSEKQKDIIRHLAKHYLGEEVW